MGQILTGGVIVLTYLAGVHYLTVYTTLSSGIRVLLFVPLLAGLLAAAWRTRWRMPAVTAAGALVLGLTWAPSALLPGDRVLYVSLAEHLGLNGFLAWVFARSLRPGREPLCSRLAREMHGALPPEVVRYTQGITLAWALLFIAILCVSVLLFFLAPIQVWSTFANLLNLPIVVAMFVIEYRVRMRALPDFKHASFLSGIQAFRLSPVASREFPETVRSRQG